MTKFEDICRGVLTAQLPNVCTGIGESNGSEPCHRADLIVTGALSRIRKGRTTFGDEFRGIGSGEIAGCTGRVAQDDAGCFGPDFICGLEESHVVIN